MLTMPSSPFLTPPPTLPPTRGSSVHHSSTTHAHTHIHTQLAYATRPQPVPLAKPGFAQHSPPYYYHPTAVTMPIPPTFAPTSRTVSLPTLQPEPDSHTPDLTHRDDEADAGDAEVNPRVEKRRRTNRGIKSELGVAPSPVRKGSSPASPAGTALSSGGGAANASTNSNPRSRANLPPIKPIGFAQSRESRDDGQDHPIPSPVVMGFDFKMIDDQQLRTVSRVPASSRAFTPIGTILFMWFDRFSYHRSVLPVPVVVACASSRRGALTHPRSGPRHHQHKGAAAGLDRATSEGPRGEHAEHAQRVDIQGLAAQGPREARRGSAEGEDAGQGRVVEHRHERQ